MQFLPYRITYIEKNTEDTCVIHLVPLKGNIMKFQSGQFAKIKNSKYLNPDEEHSFSFSSGAHNHNYLEFCIKIYGDWTKSVSQLKIDDLLYISGPYGEVIFDSANPNIVFLVGGVGISPIISCIRTLVGEEKNSSVILLYGSQKPELIVYKKELEELQQKLLNLKIVHIMSNLEKNDSWSGERGFITQEIIQKYINLQNNPVFYMYGPSIFVEKMQKLLKSLRVESDHIKCESH